MLGILGGTFDPIHYGHLAIAKAALNALPLSQVEFIPCNLPAHRDPTKASAEARLSMIKLAIQPEPKFKANSIEIDRGGISYAIDTVKALSKNNKLCFIIGQDAFLQINSWHQWQELMTYCHLIVINRPGASTTIPSALSTWYQHHHTDSQDSLSKTHHGLIYHLSVEPTPISATYIRERLKANLSLTGLTPLAVIKYIEDHGLYQATH